MKQHLISVYQPDTAPPPPEVSVRSWSGSPPGAVN
jgi:hypothetical protein